MGYVSYKQGESKRLKFIIKDENNEIVDCSSATFSFEVKLSKDESSSIISKSDSDFDKTEVEDGIVYVLIDSDDTNQDATEYVGELKVNFSENSIIKSQDIIFMIKKSL